MPYIQCTTREIIENIESRKIFLPLIQRKFSIGYNRAGRLMDQLERAGIVGPAQGAKPREVLISDEMSLENTLAQYK